MMILYEFKALCGIVYELVPVFQAMTFYKTPVVELELNFFIPRKRLAKEWELKYLEVGSRETLLYLEARVASRLYVKPVYSVSIVHAGQPLQVTINNRGTISE